MTCTCSGSTAYACSKAWHEEIPTLDGRLAIRLRCCDCRCHWQGHRVDCEGGEDCICPRAPRPMAFRPVAHDPFRSLTQTLDLLALIHGPRAAGSDQHVVRRGTVPVFIGRASEVWAWLRETGLLVEVAP